MLERFQISEFCRLLEQLLSSVKFNRIWVAHSGGCDSTALVHSFAQASEIFARRNQRLEWGIHHVNYGLRPGESCLDEEFSRKLAGQFGVPICVTKAPSPLPSKGLQSWARSVRRDEWMRLGNLGDVVALGHHLDDVAENVLFRMARGTSPGHLTGFKVWNPPLWRPFLGFRKKDLVCWLVENGADFRHDSSNDKMKYGRNKIRHQVLPLLEEMFPGAAERIAQLGFSVETQLMNHNEHDFSKASELVGTLYQYYRKNNWTYPQISRSWLNETFKIVGNQGDVPSICVPQSESARGPLQTVLCIKNGALKVGRVAETRFKKESFLRASAGLFRPSVAMKLPRGSRGYQSEYVVASLGELKLKISVTQNQCEKSHLIQIDPARSNTSLPKKSGARTCKEFFQFQKIKPEIRCRWRVIKYDGNVVSLSDGDRTFFLTEKISERIKSDIDYNDLREVKDGRRTNKTGINKILGRGAYWMV